MNARWKAWLPWTIFATALSLMAGAAVMGALSARAGVGDFSPIDMIWATSWFGLSAVGALVASRRPENKVGWLACSFALPISLLLFADEYARYALVTRNGSLPLGIFMHWVAQWPFFVSGAIGVLVLLLFPDGRLPSPRWRLVVGVTLTAAALGVFGAAFGPVKDSPFQNPFLIPRWAGPLERAQEIAGHVLIGAVATSFSLSIGRLRRARGEERHQMKWFFYGFFLMLASWSSIFILEVALGQVPEPLDSLLFVAGVLALPGGIAVAILRHRLYEIDVVINKTLVYGALAAFITAVYAGVVVVIGSPVGGGNNPSLALSLAATALVAVAFHPVRARVQRFANRLVYGERVTPYEAIASFSHRMAESLSLEEVLPKMAEAAAKGVGGARSRVRLFLPGGNEQTVRWPTDAPADAYDREVWVVHQGEKVGEIAVAKSSGEQMTVAEERLLDDLGSQAGLAMSNLRLAGELHQRLAELQQSRKRIVAAQDVERRRMERDIHDGAQQQLVSMSVKLRLAKNLAGRDPAKAAGLLEDLGNEAQEAVEALKDLARGIFPPLLAERGIGDALASFVEKMGIEAGVENRTGGARFRPETEAAVYFVVREALQNASKHAPGKPVAVTLGADDSELSFRVKNEGAGFDPRQAHPGSGLRNMADRIEALGGVLEIESAPGGGTEIRGRLPARAVGTAA